nr:MAG TPA: DNA adenine methylase [Caudoviricetes sp.]
MRYGLPYQGSKSQIAKDIIGFLPKGDRLVDLFGGGGAITHCAVESGRWGSVLYNELNSLVHDTFKGCVEGTIDTSNASRWVSREDFFRLKDTDGLVALIWSFGNNMVNYMFNTQIEPWKKALWYARMENDCSLFKEMGVDTDGSSSDIRRHADEYCRRYIQWYESRFSVPFKDKMGSHPFELESMCRLQCITRLGDLLSIDGCRLESVERLIEFTCGSYEDYVYREGDVVYCDILYHNTDCKAYKGFDNARFYEWVRTRPYQVFFSSYPIEDESFHKVFLINKRSLLSLMNKGLLKEEVIYSNRPYESVSDELF